ncbi:hypothetical protein CDAR_114701 [Caerostris darwini]|uniref:Uncharacterized protein n=1 Tax=Caerostris darwini TaxID=1538125 RepID=A0AAV4MFT5_9ARAC|nr:hypothetical protein CDAR_114701 [Caerostris darwini]
MLHRLCEVCIQSRNMDFSSVDNPLLISDEGINYHVTEFQASALIPSEEGSTSHDSSPHTCIRQRVRAFRLLMGGWEQTLIKRELCCRKREAQRFFQQPPSMHLLSHVHNDGISWKK